MITQYKTEFADIEKKSQEIWARLNLNRAETNSSKEPYVYLEMFPYPSAIGLHIGHLAGYIPSDAYCRFMRARGFNVMYTIGFDSFGLPAEQYAIETGQHPRVTTEYNVNNMISQLKKVGLSYDWERMINTSDPEYYKWTQWIFLQMYDSFFDETEVWSDGFGNEVKGRAKPVSKLRDYLESGEWHINDDGLPKPGNKGVKYSIKEIESAIDAARIAYLGEAEVNWCPKLGTVLSNEEVIDGKSERGNHPVETFKMKQWILRITKYAARLNSGFDRINWPESTVRAQQNWIGESAGANISFKTEDGSISIYTTRPDTIFGVTYIAAALEKYPGVVGFTGKYATHPITQEKIPIYTAEYVLNNYGTGYVMGVPAHDTRDFDFAKQNDLPIKAVIVPDTNWLAHHGYDSSEEYLADPSKAAYTGLGKVVLHDKKMDRIEFLNQYKHILHSSVQYRLRDWIFSRQRYWGEPFPIVYDEDGKIYAIHESELPVELPDTANFEPDIDSPNPTTPLSRCEDWVDVVGQIVDGKVITKNIDPTKPVQKFKRETNTMPNWAGSSWYWLRYVDPHNSSAMIGDSAMQYWIDGKFAACDMYLGGSEHAVLHYLYARFWSMVLHDLGHIPTPEPFMNVIHQGLITADAYSDSMGRYVDVKDVEVQDGVATRISTGEILKIEPGKMGKRYKNGIDPLDLCDQYSADVVRLHMLYMGPITQTKVWNEGAIVGMQRFCQNVCNLVANCKNDRVFEVEKELNRLIYLVTNAVQEMKFNSSIAFMIEFYNKHKNEISKDQAVKFLVLLSPMAPHLAEHLYQHLADLGVCNLESVFLEPWPTYDEAMLADKEIEVCIRVNGKDYATIYAKPDISDEELTSLIPDELINCKVIIKRADNKINLILVK